MRGDTLIYALFDPRHSVESIRKALEDLGFGECVVAYSSSPRGVTVYAPLSVPVARCEAATRAIEAYDDEVRARDAKPRVVRVRPRVCLLKRRTKASAANARIAKTHVPACPPDRDDGVAPACPRCQREFCFDVVAEDCCTCGALVIPAEGAR